MRNVCVVFGCFCIWLYLTRLKNVRRTNKNKKQYVLVMGRIGLNVDFFSFDNGSMNGITPGNGKNGHDSSHKGPQNTKNDAYIHYCSILNYE